MMAQSVIEGFGSRRSLIVVGGFLAALVAAGLLLAVMARPAHAATLTVNSTGDEQDADAHDGNPLDSTVPASTDGVCDVDKGAAGNQCTLRAAIEQANATRGKDTIKFNTPGGAPAKIEVGKTGNGELPPITDRVVIDGYSQPGSQPNTLPSGNNAISGVTLNGTNAGAFESGLYFVQFGSNTGTPEPRSDRSVVRGLAIEGFDDSGITLANVNRVLVSGNFLLSNGQRGVAVFGSNNTIGGSKPSARNEISGNNPSGASSTGRAGVYIEDIGGANSTGNKVLGNYIGVGSDGVFPWPNCGHGVYISNFFPGVSNTTIQGNTIAFNCQDGVRVKSGTGNRILSNSIFSNADLGIDLGGTDLAGDGRTLNDDTSTPPDDDIGANDLQNFPLLTIAQPWNSSTTTRIDGTLKSTPNKRFTIQFFSNPSGDTNEGKKFIGQKKVTTDANGDASFFFYTKQAPLREYVTTTATDASGNTSEFSDPRQVFVP